ncbi:MAG: TIGR00159 family protein [Planctomycetes bacterium RBG_13_62_9]|nr:MAG: TIGR00159 family protein [Planctomycetes bacterium RBG_13_62_9]
MAGNPWWAVVIELLLIGLVVWWVVDFLEGTRGERLFRGIILLLVAGVLVLNLAVHHFPLERLQYLYSRFLIAVLIVAVAAFQPEIRRVLIQIGQPRIWAGSSHQLSRTVEELISAVTQLSAARIGAIIVVERDVALGEFIETGSRLDARVTADLLKSIFYPGTPLHDMAVVIRGDRIVAARVQLPLAEAGTIDGIELGSRHRAALGIAAGSDALCLVVSEETGAISVAEKGRLIRNVTESQIRSHLTTTMAGQVPLVGRLLKRHA